MLQGANGSAASLRDVVDFYDAGHAISTDRPEAFTEVVVDFLERHEAFVISRAETVIHP